MKFPEHKRKRLIKANIIMTKIRWIYFVTLVINAVMARLISEGNAALGPFIVISLCIVAMGTNLIVYLFFRKIKEISDQAIMTLGALQITSDILVMIIIIFYAGGIMATGYIFLVYGIVASAFLFSLTGVMIVVTIDSLLYAGLLYGQYFNLIPYIARYNHPFEFYYSHNFGMVTVNSYLVVTSFYIIGLFAGIIANNLLKSEDSVYQEKEKEDIILKEMEDGLLYFNKNNKLEVINYKAEEFLDIKKEEVIGRTLNQLNKSRHRLFKEILSTSNGREREVIPKEKPDLTFLISSTEVKNIKDKVVGKIFLIRNISRQKHISKMKSEFITIAGHQLRTPLSAIKNAVSLLAGGDYGKINKEQKFILNKSADYTDRLIDIVDDLLNISSIEEGRYDYEFRKVNFNNFLFEITESFNSEVEKNNIKLLFITPRKAVNLRIDSYKLKLAIGSIINNAISYTKAGGQVEIKCNYRKGSVILSIKDNGIGIPVEVQDKIFTKFFRADNALIHKTEGNGLDLFVAKNIVENHQGKIWFKSQEGKGTTFYIELPLRRENNNIKNV